MGTSRTMRRQLSRMEKKATINTLVDNFDTVYERLGNLENRFNEHVQQFLGLIDLLTANKALKVEKVTKGGVSLPEGVVVDEPQ